MNINPIEFANSSPNNNAVNRTLRCLREIDELEKFTFVWTVLVTNESVGFRLVKSAQLCSIHSQVIFERSLVYSDASSINDWMKVMVNSLGYNRLLDIIRAHISKTPLG